MNEPMNVQFYTPCFFKTGEFVLQVAITFKLTR